MPIAVVRKGEPRGGIAGPATGAAATTATEGTSMAAANASANCVAVPNRAVGSTARARPNDTSNDDFSEIDTSLARSDTGKRVPRISNSQAETSGRPG